MKRKLVSLMLVSAMAAALLAGCGGDGGNGGSDEKTPSTDNAGENDNAGDETQTPDDSGETPSAGGGSVYLLNFKSEIDQEWQDTAKLYTELTGVPVTVLTAAEGTYSQKQQAEMAKGDDAPTLFNLGSMQAAQTWDAYTLDLKDTAVYDHLSDKSLVIEYNGKIAGVATCYECFGLIYNKTILNDYCSMDNAVVKSAEEIDSFDKLKAVAEDINKRVDEINEQFGHELTGAFSSAGLDPSSDWRFTGHLANLPLYYEFKDAGCDLVSGQAEIAGTYLDNYKNVWDMYISNSSADPKTLTSGSYSGEAELGMGECVFYQNGSWEYSPLLNPENGYLVASEDLGMMPIYFGVDDANMGLCVGTENYWAVNSQVPQENIDATLAFLEWLITSDEGRDAMNNKLGLDAPYDTFTGDFAPANTFTKDANAYMEAGKTSVAWSFNATPNVDNWRADVKAALVAYTEGTGDWDAVKTAFVDGWKTQWQLQAEAAE